MTHLALTFPGMAYHHDAPLLWFARVALRQAGATVVPVTYDDPRDDARFFAGVRRDVTAAIEEHQPERITLVGKSLGTHALAEIARAGLAPEAAAIWLTPVWSTPSWEAARSSGWRMLHVIGLADEVHAPDRQAELPGEVLAIDGADHILEIDGDVATSLAALERVTLAILDFVS